MSSFKFGKKYFRFIKVGKTFTYKDVILKCYESDTCILMNKECFFFKLESIKCESNILCTDRNRVDGKSVIFLKDE
jgi:hypothetical protein